MYVYNLTKIQQRPIKNGFSLIELIISVAIGTVVLASSLSFFTYSVRGNANSIMMATLNEELTSIANLMQREIQRTGYWANADRNNENPYGMNIAKSDCVIYRYDIDDTDPADGNFPTSDEEFGFRFNVNNATIEWLRLDSEETPVALNQFNDCNDNTNWREISDPSSVQITNVSFTEPVSNCTNISTSPRTNCNPNDCNYTPWKINDDVLEVTFLAISITGHVPDRSGKKTASELISSSIKNSIRLRNDKVIKKQDAAPTIKATGCPA